MVWAESTFNWPYDGTVFSYPEKRGGPSNSLGAIGDIAGWKTYRNEEYGFEVKYPGDWIIVQHKQEPKTVLEFKYKVYKTDTDLSTSQRIIMAPENQHLAILNFYKQHSASRPTKKIIGEDIEAENYYACGEVCINVLIFSSGTSFFAWENWGTEENKFDQILSTFRFIE